MCRTLPPLIPQPRNKKEELHNAIIQLLEKDGLAWTSSEVDCGVAGTTVKTLTDVLWYVDGHQSKFSDRGCYIPPLFEAFAGYNKPELTKHRKRSSMTLSGKCMFHVCFICMICCVMLHLLKGSVCTFRKQSQDICNTCTWLTHIHVPLVVITCTCIAFIIQVTSWLHTPSACSPTYRVDFGIGQNGNH